MGNLHDDMMAHIQAATDDTCPDEGSRGKRIKLDPAALGVAARNISTDLSRLSAPSKGKGI